ncbi:50S ribosomal protein L24e [Halorhabdus sp. BNX81]|uniref:50S ribosomal protein L24e n=1 Tax=Halorhabdus sp. BNX81 TaxID=2980181 RepID=UPI0023DD0C65|nr:50S ribosomal protein L24e [Halorhabdus sp. BNX81]WEL20906.1 Ribosomal protein L24E [Halorhabdus sp. BNX81]
MPQTRECDYCGADIEPGTGTMFVRKNGTTIHFCSSKCEKNADLGREARDLSWTEAGRGPGGETTPEQESDDDAEQVEESVEAEASEADEETEDAESVDDEGEVDGAEDDATEDAESADADESGDDAEAEEPTEADA